MNYPDFLLQRLRSLPCRKCRKSMHPTASNVRHVGMVVSTQEVNLRLHVEVACPRCASSIDLHLEHEEVQWTETLWWMAARVGQEKWNSSKLMAAGISPQDRGQSLKFVHFLDARPGRADAPGVGEPIAMITLEHNGEIEQPLMMKMRDVLALSEALISVIEHHAE